MKSTTLFKALSDQTRLRLVNILWDHELGVNDLVCILGAGQSGISRHLKILHDAGLLNCRRNGTWAFYSVSRDGVHYRFLESINFLFQEEDVFLSDLNEVKTYSDSVRDNRRQFFDSIAAQWDLLKLELLGDVDINQLILDQVDSPAVAVDLGCGTGELLAALRSKAEQLIGVDSSSRMLQETGKRLSTLNSPIDLRLGELEHLPLKNEEADLATISMTLHHLAQPQQAIVEVSRILKQGGSLVLVDFLEHGNESLRKQYGFKWLGFKESEIESWLTRSGLRLISAHCHPLPRSLKLIVYRAIKSE